MKFLYIGFKGQIMLRVNLLKRLIHQINYF